MSNEPLKLSNNKLIEEKIEEIIKKRHEQIPLVEEKLLQLKNAGSKIENLNELLDSIINNNELTEEFKESCRDINQRILKDSYDNSLKALEHLKTRFERNSINIGVTGHSQVGKSTLLQLISGLDNSQIPRGDGVPTTAARSRIFNVSSKDKEKALITFYSEKEFINIVLKPYFSELEPFFYEINKNNNNNDLHCPFSVEEFLNMQLPVILKDGYFKEVNEDFKNTNADAKKKAILERLWEMQHDSSSWKNLLNYKEIRAITLNEIRKYIAYPTEEEIKYAKNNNKTCERAYLAVKDAEIRCCFDNANIQHLGIFDLPGLGEVIPKDAMFCIMQYDTELDLTVLITRPTIAFKKLEHFDIEALANANNIRYPIENEEDFTVVILNKHKKIGISDKEDIQNFIDQIHALNSKYSIFTGDITDSNDLQNILKGILEHLANKLSKMDKDYLDNALKESNKFLAICENTKKKIEEIIAKHNPQISDIDLDDEVVNKITNMNIEFTNLLAQYKSKTVKKDDDKNPIMSVIEAIYKENEDWAEQGLGNNNQDSWIKDAQFKSKNPQGGKPGFINSEFNRLRTKLRKGYSKLNESLTIKVEDLFYDISTILKKYTGELLNGDSGKKMIEQMLRFSENVNLAKTKGKKCETFIEAFKDLLDIKFEYRCFYDEDCFKDLENLNEDAVNKKHIKELTEVEDYKTIFNYIKGQFNSRNYNIKENLEKNALKADWIIYNSLANFIDIFIFSESSKKEFKYLCASYKEYIFADSSNKFLLEKIKRFEFINNNLSNIIDLLRRNGEK